MSRFFIDRPIFAWVIAIVIMLAGALAIFNLPVAQYPAIAPPAVTIQATYPGASAETLQDSVTQVIEQRMTGLDGFRYMKSTSDSTGRLRIELTFEPGTNPDIAQVQVQNKLSLAVPLLPDAVQRQGIQVTKSATGYLLVIAFTAVDGAYTSTELADFITTNVQDTVSRVTGVGEVQVFGSPYAMRIWLNPDKMNQFKVTPGDIRSAVLAQNAQVSAGELGGAPAVKGQTLTATITAQTLLETPKDFEQIILRTTEDGATVRLKDVARIDYGSENYNILPRWNGRNASGIGIRLASGANALDTAEGVIAEMERITPLIPEGMEWDVAYDTTPFVKISIEGVVKTLIEAIILVFLVMYLFLQNFRATLIPTIAVPVVLLGTFAVLSAFGFSINTLTMFAMVLAIGLLVDDAIVVVENVERVMAEEGLSPLEATRKSMDQITGALVGIGLVLSAVFVPMAFFPGSAGVIYKQFSITIVSAMALSVIVALVLTPALCATMLKPVEKGHTHEKKGFFGWFNRKFDSSNARYQGAVGRMLHKSGRSLIIYGGLLAITAFMFTRLPTSFLPDEDQGVFFTQVQLPAGATQEQTLQVLAKMEDYFLNEEGDNVKSLFTVAGFSFSGTGQNSGIGFVRLRDWSERPGKENSAAGIVQRASAEFASWPEAQAFAFAPPAIRELGNASGFNLFIQDRTGLGRDALIQARNTMIGEAAKNPVLMGVRPNATADTPQYQLDIDNAKAGALGVSVSEISDTLTSAWGGSFINDFLDRGRVKRVYMQADAPFRMLPEDLNRFYVRNNDGEMVPFSNFSSAQWSMASPRLERYNGLPAVEIQGQAAPGMSSGDAMDAMEAIAENLPEGMGIEWTGLSYEERQSGSQAPLLYALSLLIVFLCLAALYESWSIPFAVMLIVPLGVVGALLAASGRGLANDVYFQVALLTTVGLSAKNAILIVEFAKEQFDQGRDLLEATLDAVRMRLRPIIMTSLAFGLGVVPLAISTGAGSGSQNAIGTGVLGGTISATVLGIFFVPIFFVVVTRLFGNKRAKQNTAAQGE
ncbi:MULTISPECIES: efflux RND transporter permease subunit [unclassified Limnobacter]|uniref:efflux RND transporter permease subunit n=1 Tax=unclassified Limnobacter TaxID=2630203 RepID=UPI000C4D08DF|nr:MULTISPECIES: efflux RND transporter permease subunit [unclassified Limnobacter]MAZ11135.1 hydrophobe/amphiphile efflux-1 family RND transporter [Sutterellaceae bacterium]|tara:strand:- start:58140 stop:61274 length:3135 start_codon:yes stop_codon:yes gene_type:complete